MSDLMVAVLALAAVGGPVAGLTWLARRVRSRGGSGGYSLMGPFDELWHPAAVAARLEVEVYDERQEPAPAPGDGLFPRLTPFASEGAPCRRAGGVDDRHDVCEQSRYHPHRSCVPLELHVGAVPTTSGGAAAAGRLTAW